MDSAPRNRQQDFRFLDELIASSGGSSIEPSTLDIRAYTSQIKSQLTKLEEEATLDFMALNQNAFSLYQDISKSEKILGRVGEVVDGFQGELERISDEVRTLQDRSESYHLQLKNRKNLNKLLTKYIDNTMLTRQLIDALCNQDIDQDLDDYLMNVEKLNEMIFYVSNPPNLVG